MKRNILYHLLLAMLVAFVAAACVDDMRDNSVFAAEGGDAMIAFSVENVSLTRAIEGQDMESGIDHAYLLFYPSEVAIENAIPLAAVKADVSAANPNALSFKMPLSLEQDTDYNLLAIANADSYLPEGFSSFATYIQAWCNTQSDTKENLHLYHADRILAGDVDCLPMLGRIVGNVPFRFSMQNGNYSVSTSLSFRRMVARIDVANIISSGFRVEGVSLCNWRDAASIVSTSNIGTVRGVLADGGDNSESVSFIPLEDISGFQQLKASIYTFPSAVSESNIGDKESTALIIRAKYSDDSESSFYRVNVGMNGRSAEVKANTKYMITIQSVKGRGASTPEEAYSSTESNLELSVVEEWDVEGGYAMDEYGNFIILSRGTVEFDEDPEENAEVKVLVSKGLGWDVEYHPKDEASNDAFSVSKISSSIIISPQGKNATDSPFSGICRVSALTPEGNVLKVDISLLQKNGGEQEGPVIPWDKHLP